MGGGATSGSGGSQPPGGSLEEGAFQLDLEKQVHYAHAGLREETLREGKEQGQRCREDGSIQNKCSMIHLRAQQIMQVTEGA